MDVPTEERFRKHHAQQAVLQLKIVLLGTKPPIWRRLLVPAEFTLAQLHDVIQAAMSWDESHLYAFRIGRQSFGFPGRSGPSSEKKTYLGNVLNNVGAKATYIYDFGDSWEHAVSVEKILPAEPNVDFPLCIGGKFAGPPEDCGGIAGFYHTLEALADPNHEDHEDMQDWIESFDPEAFSIEAINQKLRAIFRAPRKPNKPKPKRAAKQKSPDPPPCLEIQAERLRGGGISRPSPEDLGAALQAIQLSLRSYAPNRANASGPMQKYRWN